MSTTGFADVNGQHIFHCVDGAGKFLVLLLGGISPDGLGANLAEQAEERRVIAAHLRVHGRMPDADRPLCGGTTGDDVAALIGHLGPVKADVMSGC